MFRPSWTPALAASPRTLASPRPPRAPRTPPPPTLRDDAGHASEFAGARHPHPEWFTEWWYFNVRDPDSGLAMLCMYEFSPYGPGIGAFASMVFQKDRAPFHVADPYLQEDIAVSEQRPEVKIGKNRVECLDPDTYRITAASRDGRLGYDLILKRVAGAGPEWLLHQAPGPLDWEIGYWITWLPHATASGTVTIDGKKLKIEKAAAYHDHNWGAWCAPIRNWQWLQASSPTERVSLDLGYSDGFDPPRAALLDLDGRAIRFDWGGIEVPTYASWKTWPDTAWKYPERAHVRLTDTTGLVRVDVQWEAPGDRTLPLPGAAVVLFEQHVDVTLEIFERRTQDAPWGRSRLVRVDGIAEWSESILAEWTTGQGLLGGYAAEATVFGAGVTGLTAAHELVERGFAVTVVEPEVALDPAGRQAMAVGGMARSHYARVPRLGPAPSTRPAGRPTADATDDRWQDAIVVFEPDSSAIPTEAELALVRAARDFRDRYIDQSYRLRVIGSAAAGEAEPRALAVRRAEAVRDALVKVGIADDLVIMAEGPASAPRAVLELEDYVLPGEHGFRFFPSYYRHLNDTMSRTPTYDREGRQDGGRVVDNLAPTPDSVMLRSGQAPAPPPGTNVTALQMLRMAATALGKDGYDPKDFLQMGLRLMRYLATCPDRRQALEDISWWAYLSGYCKKTGCYLYRYSNAFARDATASGRVLAAFDWRYGDARTNGSTWIQLFEPLPDAAGSRFDGTLNAPTSEAWFVHWRRYLEERGVRFVTGKLDRFTQRDGRVSASWTPAGKSTPEPYVPRTRGPHYVVCATDAPTAESASKELPPHGVPERLRGFTTTYRKAPGEPPITRDPRKQPGLGKNDRLQTLSGVQYFFDQSFAISTHAYSLDAPWSLTSLSMQRAWARLPIREKDGFAGLLSVDIGDFRVPAGPDRVDAWDSSKERLGEQVWLQLCNDLRTAAAMPLRLPRPTWFHVDDNLSFGDRDGLKNVVIENATPYLVPITADWQNRPGPAPFDPNVPTATAAAPPAPGVWQAPHGGYPVHFGGLVYAGIYLKTFTRMTTMESANESGRHAVNAILDHFNAHHGDTVAPAEARTRPTDPTAIEADQVPASFLGDYCGIWNIERYEPSNFDGLKGLDQILHDLGLPHVFDLLGVELVPSILSHLLPYKGDCSSTSQAPPAPVPPPSKWCPPFVGEWIQRWKRRH